MNPDPARAIKDTLRVLSQIEEAIAAEGRVVPQVLRDEIAYYEAQIARVAGITSGGRSGTTLPPLPNTDSKA